MVKRCQDLVRFFALLRIKPHAPFTVSVNQGDKVEKGQPLATMDFQMITDKGYDDSCIVVYTNMDLVKSVTPIEKGAVKHSQKVQTIEFN